jgi:hypothetical protein
MPLGLALLTGRDALNAILPAAAATVIGRVAWPLLCDLPDDVHFLVQLLQHLDPPCDAERILCPLPLQFLHCPFKFSSFSDECLLPSSELVVFFC